MWEYQISIILFIVKSYHQKNIVKLGIVLETLEALHLNIKFSSVWNFFPHQCSYVNFSICQFLQPLSMKHLRKNLKKVKILSCGSINKILHLYSSILNGKHAVRNYNTMLKFHVHVSFGIQFKASSNDPRCYIIKIGFSSQAILKVFL